MQHLPTNSLLQGGKYRIEKVLGQGGFGITYLATQDLLDRKVCIKEFFFKDSCSRNSKGEVTLGTVGNRDLVERFLNKFIKEARTLSQLDHPNIIRVLDIFKENNTAYYVMDFIEGSSLEDVVNSKGPLSESVAIDYIKQVASALDYIHQRKLNHLDVKPANIMIRKSDNKAILIDFGVSKQYDSTGEQTSTTPVGISYGYAPIEQYRPGGVVTFSPQADIYALGATLYKMLTGDVPPQAMEILNDGLPNTFERFSSQVRNAIKKSMQVRKQDRFDSINCFLSCFKDDFAQLSKITLNNESPNEDAKLAQMYFEKAESITVGENSEPEDSFPFYLKAAKLGHVEAQIEVGLSYKTGCGIEEDKKKAFEWYKKAAESENVDALEYLAECYNEGIGTKTDKLKAFEIYNKAFEISFKEAENGDEDAMCRLTYYYKNGLGVPRNSKQVFVWTKRLVEKYQTNEYLAKLGYYYEIGYGTEINIKKSSELYAKVIEMSDANDLYNIGDNFASENNNKEKEQAHKWFAWAVEKKDPEIIKDIANIYSLGDSVEKDLQKAIILYERAATLGNVEAMVHLGYMYFCEEKFQNYAEAIKWWKKAITPENTHKLQVIEWVDEKFILETIANMYEWGGYGIIKNESEASKWNLRAKEFSKKGRKLKNDYDSEETKIL